MKKCYDDYELLAADNVEGRCYDAINQEFFW
jgi:hypothetical protein